MSALPLFADAPFAARPLRPHQHKALAMLKSALLAGNKRIVVQMPTGAGKTRTAAEIVLGALAKGNRVAFTVPAISLVDQTVEAFEGEGIDAIGVVQANHERTHYGMPVQVCSVQSLARRHFPEAEVVVVDECHQQFEVVKRWMAEKPNTVFVGLTATPWARGMAEDWQALVTPVRMQELIDAGFLSPFRVYAPSHPDLSGVKTLGGDYDKDQLADVMGDAVLVADIVQTWKRLANWQPTLVFAVNRAHAAKLQAEFASHGVQMGYCDADVDRIERKVLFDRMARGDLAGIVNVATLTTGVDADVRCVVLARPTKSEMLFVQMIGRALRTAPGKTEALILDHADNHARLGFVTDIHHPHLLDGKGKNPTRKEKGEVMPKECKSCGALKPPKVRECPACGFTPTVQSEIDVADGELQEITRPLKRKATREEKTQWYWAFQELSSKRNYNSGWVSHAYRKRFGVWPQSIGGRPQFIPPEVVEGAANYARHLNIKYAKYRGKSA